MSCLEVLHLFPQHRPARGTKDHPVPQALQREDDGAGEVEPIACTFWVGKRVDAVDAAGGPGDENRKRKHERRAEVGELDRIEVAQLPEKSIPRSSGSGKGYLAPTCGIFASLRAGDTRNARKRVAVGSRGGRPREVTVLRRRRPRVQVVV